MAKGVEKLCIFISRDHAKWTRRQFWLQLKGKSKSWFRMTMRKFHTIMRNAPRRQIWVLVHFPLRTIVRNCWSSCEIAFFSRFLGKEASERPLKWCQVFTWPWPINRNLIYLFWEKYTFSNCKTFQISFLYRIFYFPSFSFIFSLAKHVLWDQISKHEWLNLVFLEGGKIYGELEKWA